MSTRCPSCGFEMGNSNRRSNPDHARLFALVHKAFHQWPEGHKFAPQNAEHLRAWLVCKAGPEWRNARATVLDGGEKSLIAEALRHALGDDQKRFVVEFPGGVAVISPKSMSFTAMSQAEFGKLRDAITDVIEAEIGCTVADLMQEAA
jgi:hypothetical protein